MPKSLISRFLLNIKYLALTLLVGISVSGLADEPAAPSGRAVRHILAVFSQLSIKPGDLVTISSRAKEGEPETFRVDAEYWDLAPMKELGKAAAVVQRYVFGGFGKDRSYLWLLNFSPEGYRNCMRAREMRSLWMWLPLRTTG